LVLTRVRPETDVSYGELSHRIDLPLLGKIPEDETVRESLYSGTPIVAYDPESPASLAYRNLASTLVTGVPEPAKEATIGADRNTSTAGSRDSGRRSNRTAATDGEGMTATSHKSDETATNLPPETSHGSDSHTPDTGSSDQEKYDTQPDDADDHGVTFSESSTGAADSHGPGAEGEETGINLDPVDDDLEETTDLDDEDSHSDIGEDGIDSDLDDDGIDSELTEDAIPFQGESRPLDEEPAVTFEDEPEAEEDDDDDDDDGGSSGGLFSRLFG
jgi:hypothetical protein